MKKFFYGFKEYMMCFLIAAGSSALSLLTINVFLARLMFTIREAEFMDLMDKLVIEEGWNIFPILSQILPFAVATGLIIYYVAPFYNKSATEIDEKVGARVVRAPFVTALIGALSWSIGFILQVSPVLAIGLEYPLHILLKSLIFLTSQSMLVFIISFYLLEWYYREQIIPRAFPNNTLRHIPQLPHDSIQSRFSTFMLAVFGFPTVVFANIILTASAQDDDPFPLDLVLPVAGLILGMTLVFLLLKALVTRSIEAPLKDMVDMTKKIEGGILDVSTRIKSTDQLGLLGESLNEMAQGLAEREVIRDTFGRMVDPSIRDHLLGGHTRLGGEFIDCSIMFIDIRGYTNMSEGRSPEEIVLWLNQFFDRCQQAVKDQKGVVNKYIGDAVMAIFGAPIKSDEHAQQAVNAAIKTLKAISELNTELRRDQKPELAVRIGIHSGKVLAGNIGASDRMEYTVIGDAVNLASRLESLCRNFDTSLLISRATFDMLKNKEVFKFVEQSVVKGRMQKVDVYGLM